METALETADTPEFIIDTCSVPSNALIVGNPVGKFLVHVLLFIFD